MADHDKVTQNRPPGDDSAPEAPSNQSVEFAATLRAWRLARGLTQDQLAELAGVSKSSISMAERAFHHLPPKEITQIRLARALQVSLAELRQMPSGFEATMSILAPAPKQQPEQTKGTLPVEPSPYNERDMSALHLPAKWVLGATDIPNELSYLVVSDASMQPTLKVGDIAIIEPSSTMAAGILMVGRREGDAVSQVGIRRVIPAQSDKVRISCDNERFDRTTVQTEEQTAVLGRVLFVVRAIELE